jgi:zinc finger CCHC domain-containing protein 9
MDLNELANKLRSGELSGQDLAKMMAEEKITKTERRKVVKLSQKEEVVLSERQKLRLEVKEKKALPKISKEERRQKFGKDVENEREKEAANFTVCLGCRKRGHFVKDCPKLALAPSFAEQDRPEVCFNCGSSDHTLKSCPKPRDSGRNLKFANCFICKKIGHISRDCPENPNGLYPNGGCCHICLQKTHLVRDCPERTEEDKQMAQIRRQQQEDAELGVRVKGLTSDDNADLKGDEFAMDYASDDGNDSDNSNGDAPPKKKQKKDKSDKKKDKKNKKSSK